MLRNPCALTLGDEPLAGGVEHGAHAALDGVCAGRHTASQPCPREVREQPTRPWQSGIQQLLKHPMQRHLPLSCLGLQQSHRIGPDADKPPQVALGCDVLRHEPTDLPRAHACEQPEEQCTVQHPVLGCQQDADLVIRQHTMGMNLWPVFDLEGFPGVGSSSPSPTHQSRNWDICLRIRAWVWGARVIPSEATDRLARSAKPASFPCLYLRTLGESWVMYPSTSFPWLREGHQQHACPECEVNSSRQSAPT